MGKPIIKQGPKPAPLDPPSRGEVETLVANEPIRIDGTDIAPGETFEASPVDAEALLASGAATAAG